MMIVIDAKAVARTLAFVAYVQGSTEAIAEACSTNEGMARALVKVYSTASLVADDMLRWLEGGSNGEDS